jgi:hypothetical protein
VETCIGPTVFEGMAHMNRPPAPGIANPADVTANLLQTICANTDNGSRKGQSREENRFFNPKSRILDLWGGVSHN